MALFGINTGPWRKVGLLLGITAIITGSGVAVRHQGNDPGSNLVRVAAANDVNVAQGNWTSMPGVSKTADGLLVRPTNLSLVEQDGSLAAPNPAVNLAGIHLDNVTGDFTMTAVVRPLQSTTATLQLYGNVPIIADEFRVERQSVRLAMAKDKLTVSVWNGSKQRAVQTKTFTFSPQASNTLTLKRQAKTLMLSVNGKGVGTVNESGALSTGQMWFGLDAQGGNWLLASMRVQLTSGAAKVVDGTTSRVQQHAATGLQARASQQRPGFLVGAAGALGPLTADAAYAQVALDNKIFGSLTPENGLKMINLQPQRGVYTFEHADALVGLATQNGLKVHGHTLVFGEANPTWLTALPVKTAADKGVVKQVMQDHVTKVVTHYKQDIQSWDVINEPIADYDDFDRDAGKTLRNHKWYQAMGQDYIVTALVAAHRANPNAMLFINEYGLEENGERWDTFKALLQQLTPKLAAQGVPINKLGVGFQAHVYASGDKINPTILRQHIQQLEKLGFKAQISEMDVYSDDGTNVQADQYAKVYGACLAEKNCVAWRAWIMSDRYNFWKDDDGTIYQGQDGLYDKNMKPTPAIQRMLAL